MGVSVVFEGGSDAIEVVPGEQAQLALRLQNTGMVVDRIVLDVLGDAAEWAQVEPAQVNLLPGAAEQVHIKFTPPRVASLAPGEVPFALRAMSTEDPEGSSIEEGHVRVAEFADLGVQLVPKSATGRRSARFRLVVENRGNRPEPLRLEPFDPDAKLGFKTRPAAFVARPGTATFVRLKAVPRKTFFRGPNRTLPFEISALPEEGMVASDEGVMLEKQVLPEWLFPLIAVAAVVCGVLFALWFTVLRPVVNSAATAAGNASSAQAQAQNAAAQAAKAAAANKSSALTGLSVKMAAPAVLTGSTDLATASGTASNGSNSNPKVVWTSSDPNVATVSQSGVVTAVNPGTVTITATNGSSSSASPSAAGLPTDLSGPTGSVSGPPVAGGAAPSVVSGSATVNVVGPVSVSTVALPQAVLGKSYSESLTGTGGTGAYTWSVASGSLPPGFTLSPDGVLTGTASAVGTTSFKVQLVNAGPPYQFASKTFTLPVIDAPAVSTSSLPGATIGTLYTQTLTAVFGTAPYTWSLVPGQGSLPNGLVLNGSTGQLSGTPTTTGVFSFSVQVTDSAAQPQSASQPLSIAVANPLNISTPSPLPQEGVKNAPYSLTLTATGGTAPYTWSVTTGSLPLGLTLNSASGVITGIPTVSGPSQFTVQAISTGPPAQTISKAMTVTVVDAPLVSTSSLQDATIGTHYDEPVNAELGTKPYAWSLVPGQGLLPDGLTIDPVTGEITGNPTTAGTSTFTVQAIDSTTPKQVATQHLSIAVADPLTITTPAALPRDGVKNAPFSTTLALSGGKAPFTWSVSKGTLPLGLSLNSATGEISGTPTVSAAPTNPFLFSVQVVDSGVPVRSATQDVSLKIVDAPVVATSSLLGGTTGDPTYDQPLKVDFGTAPFTWSLVPGQGDLPGGLKMDPGTGEITGTPTGAGTFNFTVQAVDSTTPKQVATQHLSIAIADPLRINTMGLPGGVVSAPYSRALNASGGTQPYTWSVPPGSLPAGLSLDAASGVISGTPTAAVTDPPFFTVTVSDSGNKQRSATQQLKLVVVSGLSVTTSSLPQAAVGQAGGYAAQLSATGGTGPYVWTPTGTLPKGLTLDPTGAISGTPKDTGVFPFTVQVTDGSAPPLTITQSLSITVVGSLQITTQSLADALAGQPYSQTLTATGGTAPYTWSVPPGSLPAGLSLDPVTGFISGTAQATTAAPLSITFTVTDSGPPVQTTARTFTLRVSSPLTFTMPRIPVAVVGQAFDVTPAPPSGGSGTFVWSESGALPDGVKFSTTTGELSGPLTNAAVPGTYPFKITLNDQAGGLPPLSAQFSITVVAQLAVPGSANLTGTFGAPLHSTIQPTGGLAPYSFAFDPTGLPPWLSIDPATGVISGTPDAQCATTTSTVSGAAEQFACPSVTLTEHVTVKDSIGESQPVTVSLVVTAAPLVVDHNTSVTQTAGTPFDLSAGTVHGGYGSGAITFTATGLPCSANGKVCDQIDFSTGKITGTLADFGQNPYTVTVTVTQDDPTPGSSNTYVAVYTLTINTASASTSASASAGPTP
jgi:hypothetical protein